VADQVISATTLPFLHIADPTGAAIRDAGLDTVLLLGTAFTMEEDFYRSRLAGRHGIRCLLPSASQREQVHRVIYDELCAGIVSEASREMFRRIVVDAVGAGAQGVILGCTEVGSLLQQQDSPVRLFDTAALHAVAAVDFALGG
jgi:aspartate racemase